jgi:hypothetical protein
MTSGLVIWLLAGLLLYHGLNDYLFAPRADGHRVAQQVWEFVAAERRLVPLRLEGNWPLAAGDPIYAIHGPQHIRQVGEIRRVYERRPEEAGPLAEALLYPHAPPVYTDSSLTYYTTPTSMTWVMETMLPQEKRVKIAEEIVTTYQSYHAEILDLLEPVVIAALTDAMEVVEEDLIASLARHRSDWEALGNRYQDRVVEQELVPLMREEIWPIVRQHAEPLAEEIGREMFERASLWRFGWRAIYDRSFLPEKNLTEQEWTRFMREEGMPVLDSHSADMVAVQRRIVEGIADNPKVRTTLRRNLTRVIDDPEFQVIVWEVFREVLVDNPRLHERLEQRWNTEEARQAVQMAADYLEPCVRRIGDLLFGTRQEGIAPEFAQVLRNQILDKDCRWLVLETPVAGQPLADPPDAQPLPVRLGGYPQVNPFAVQLQGVN